MLPLRYLENNTELVKIILEHWGHDADSAKSVRTYYAGGNAVFSFPYKGKNWFIRCAPEAEKGELNWQAELNFLEYLREKKFPCCRAVPSKGGNLIESVSTDEGAFLAIVLEEVPGERLDTVLPTMEAIKKVGETLGRLHTLSEQYHPEEKPWGPELILPWCMQELKRISDQDGAVWEATRLMEAMAEIRKPTNGYGVLHHDFIPENLFLREDGTISVIDFEDCMEGWFADDLDKAVNGVMKWVKDFPGEVSPERARIAMLSGYKSAHVTPGRMWAYLPRYRRFEQLYDYTRLVRAIREKPEKETKELKAIRARMEAQAAEMAVNYQTMNTMDDTDPEDLFYE